MASPVAIKNPGHFKTSSQALFVMGGMALVGACIFVVGLQMDPTRAWVSFVQNHFYFMSLGLGGIFFAAIQWVTGAMWSAPIRRLSEAFSAYLPVVFITFAILCLGVPHLYLWSHADHVQGDLILEGKAGYLSIGFFAIRNFIAIGLWLLLSVMMIRNSTLQDRTHAYALTLKNRVLAPIFLIVFALGFTMASFDQLMSLDPHWFSTIFGVYCFAGLFYSNLAATCLLTLYLKGKGKLEGIVSQEHLHDLGKFMFAFTVFWAYIGFCQFMLIWYANLPEETGYYLKRFHGAWYNVSVFLLVGKFALPFILLLPRAAKRNAKILGVVGVFMLVAQWIDVLWMVQPEFFVEGPRFGWIELGVTLGFLGVFGLCVARFLAKHNIVAIGDPRLEEAVFHHHQ
jgi:hypothetical protein